MNQFSDSDTENIKEKMQRIAIADSLAPSHIPRTSFLPSKSVPMATYAAFLVTTPLSRTL